jgi:hypothetical protein
MHHNTLKTLLAVITAFSAKFGAGNAISFIQKQRPLLFPSHSRHIKRPKIKKHRKDTLNLVSVIFRGENRAKLPF